LVQIDECFLLTYVLIKLFFIQMHTMGKPDHITPEFPSEEAEFEAVPRHMDTLQIVSVVYTYILAYLVLSTEEWF